MPESSNLWQYEYSSHVHVVLNKPFVDKFHSDRLELIPIPKQIQSEIDDPMDLISHWFLLLMNKVIVVFEEMDTIWKIIDILLEEFWW